MEISLTPSILRGVRCTSGSTPATSSSRTGGAELLLSLISLLSLARRLRPTGVLLLFTPEVDAFGLFGDVTRFFALELFLSLVLALRGPCMILSKSNSLLCRRLGVAGAAGERGLAVSFSERAWSSVRYSSLAVTITTVSHQLVAAMREAVSIQLGPLSEALKQEGLAKRGSKGDPAPWLDRLAALFRGVEPPAPPRDSAHPCLPALCDAWPVIRDHSQSPSFVNRYKSESHVMERACRALRFALRCVGKHGAPLLPALAQTMATLYAAKAHSCLLYLASILVDEMANEPACVPTLIGLLQQLMPRAFALLQQPDGLKDNPDTVDDLFRLCIRFVQRIPVEFFSSDALDAAARCASLAAALDHRDANASVMKFMHDTLRTAAHSRPDRLHAKELAIQAVRRYGPEWTRAVVEASALHLHAYMLGEVADVLLQLVAAQRVVGQDWLGAALQHLPRGRAAATDHQCAQFHQYALGAEKCKEMTRLLRDFARLYR